MKPAIPITNPSFRYTPADKTDLAKRFADIRWQQERDRRERERREADEIAANEERA